jgi:hypothetical protein
MPTTTNNGWSYPSSTDLVKDGATNFQTLATGIDTSTGKGLIAWQTYTPVLGGTGWALGSTGAAAVGYYCQIGKTVHFTARLTFGTVGATFGAARPTVTIPVTASSQSSNVDFVTNITYFDSSATQRYQGSCDFTTTNMDLFVWKTDGTYSNATGLTSAIPMTWAASDVIYLAGTYEAA